MASHAEQLQQAERALVEAALAFNRVQRSGGPGTLNCHRRLFIAGDNYEALLAATCPTCDGAGKLIRTNTRLSREGTLTVVKCRCDNGRKRDDAR